MSVVEPVPSTESAHVDRSVDPRRAAAQAHAARFVIELQRRARNARTRRGPLLKAPAVGSIVRKLSITGLARPLALSALLLVVAPGLAATAYFGWIASDVYEAEARFAVRTGAVSGIDAFTSVAGIPSVNQVQDSLIVTNFITSRAAVDVLEASSGLRKRYDNSNIDPLSRLAEDAPIEDVVRFWQHKVSVAIEAPSGIISAHVRAFSPADAQALAEALVQASEQLVNKLGARARDDLVANSERELHDVEERLRASRKRLNELRIAEGVIDPQLTAQGINVLMTELRGEAVKLEQEIATVERTISANAPQIQLMKTRLGAIREQSEALQNELTLRRAEGRDALSAVMTRFDQLALERQVLERQYTTAAAALEQARSAAARQQMYRATFVRPILPEDPSGPRRVLWPLLITLGLLIAWGIGAASLARWRARAG
jgi:capsular polysaccharide transport system permease protein